MLSLMTVIVGPNLIDGLSTGYVRQLKKEELIWFCAMTQIGYHGSSTTR